MKKLTTKIGFIAIIALMELLTSCKDKSSTNEESYGPNENYRNETPTENDEATNDTSAHETGPGSATVGDTLHKSAN
jgi:hypothetical protein